MTGVIDAVRGFFGGGPRPTIAQPAPTATQAQKAEDTSQAQDRPGGFQSFISTAQTGLTRKANTRKRSLIGGA